MRKRLALAALAGLAAIAACVGSDPDQPPGSIGGLGDPCVGPVCLEGLACIQGFCRVASSATGDAQPTVTDGSSSHADTDAPATVDGPDATGGHDGGADADAADAEGPEVGAPDAAGPDAAGPDDGGLDDGGPDAGAPDADAAPVCSEIASYRICGLASTVGSGVEWTNPSNACSAGSASVAVTHANDVSKELVVTGFAFTIPDGAVVESVAVRIDLSTGPGTSGVFLTIRPFTDEGDLDPRSPLVQTGGAPDVVFNDFQNPGFSPAAIRSSFGVRLKATLESNDQTLAIDEVSVTVAYCQPH